MLWLFSMGGGGVLMMCCLPFSPARSGEEWGGGGGGVLAWISVQTHCYHDNKRRDVHTEI